VLELTPKQLKVLEFIRQFIAQNGVPPTRGEIADGLRLKNRQGIDQHLRALQAKGAIELLAGMSRGIRLLDPPEGLPAAQRNTLEANKPASIRLPVLGRIAAGAPILAVENIEEQIGIDAEMFKPRADFLLRVRGDSMRDANILDRDLLAVHQTSHARDGQIVIARIGDEATVKYYERRDDRVVLKPANPDYAPIEVDLRKQAFAIEGLAVGVIRREIRAAGTDA
jgi:repressor LexA